MTAYRRKQRDNHWHYRRVVLLRDGSKQRVSGKAPINTKRSAEEAERAHVARILNPAPGVAEADCTTFEDFALKRFVPDSHHDWKRSEMLSTETILQKHLLPRLGKELLSAIRPPAIERVKADLRSQGLSDKTVYNVLTLLRRVLRYAKDQEILLSVPVFKMPKGVRQAKREAKEMGIRKEMFLTFDQLEGLLSAIDSPQLRAMVLIAARTGLRAGELRALRWEDIDWSMGRITVVRAEARGVVSTPKSGSGRRIPLPKVVREALAALPRSITEGALCFTVDGSMVSEQDMATTLSTAGCAAKIPTALGRRVRRAARNRASRLRLGKRPLTEAEKAWMEEYRQTKVTRFGWHTLRHTFCTHLAMAGTPILKIQQWAGHADISTTQRYLHWAPQNDDVLHIDGLDSPSARVLRII